MIKTSSVIIPILLLTSILINSSVAIKLNKRITTPKVASHGSLLDGGNALVKTKKSPVKKLLKNGKTFVER